MKNRNRTIKTMVLTFLTVFTLSIMMSVPSIIFAQEDNDAEDQEPVVEELFFDISYPELRDRAGVAFEFSAQLKYEGEETKTFDLFWEAPEGWNVSIKPAMEQAEISAVNIDPGATERLTITANPLVRMDPDDYQITVFAEDEESGLEAMAEFTAVVTAYYELGLRTKTGRLSTELNTGQDNRYDLIVENKGTASIDNITLSASPPEGWDVDFDSTEIESIEAGGFKEISTTIRPPEQTIAGDYMITFNARSQNSTDSIDLRVTALTPTVWGWVGIGIIVVVIVGVAIIFARLGRR